MTYDNRNVKIVGIKQSKPMEDLNEIFADFSSQDMTNHSILTNETLANTLKSAFSNLSFQERDHIDYIVYISKFS